MIATIEIAYSAGDFVRKLDRDRYNQLRQEAEILYLPEWTDGENEPPYWSMYGSQTLAVVPQDTLVLDKWGVGYTVVNFRNTYRVEDPDTHQHVHVHIPNFELLSIREVTHLDDACTDALQRLLNEGWSIIAVCPPNATRRPDYILGRAEKK